MNYPIIKKLVVESRFQKLNLRYISHSGEQHSAKVNQRIALLYEAHINEAEAAIYHISGCYKNQHFDLYFIHSPNAFLHIEENGISLVMMHAAKIDFFEKNPK